MLRCIRCEHDTVVRLVDFSTVRVGEEHLTIRIDGKKCARCGQQYLSPEAVARSEYEVAHMLMRREQIGSAAFRYVCKVCRIDGDALPGILVASAQSVRAWRDDIEPMPSEALRRLRAHVYSLIGDSVGEGPAPVPQAVTGRDAERELIHWREAADTLLTHCHMRGLILLEGNDGRVRVDKAALDRLIEHLAPPAGGAPG